MVDQTPWSTGRQFTVTEVKPPPEGRTFVLYQVVRIPQDGPEAQFRFWCEPQRPEALSLHAHDVVAVRGATSSRVSVERLVQGVPDGSRYLLVIPNSASDTDWPER